KPLGSRPIAALVVTQQLKGGYLQAGFAQQRSHAARAAASLVEIPAPYFEPVESGGSNDGYDLWEGRTERARVGRYASETIHRRRSLVRRKAFGAHEVGADRAERGRNGEDQKDDPEPEIRLDQHAADQRPEKGADPADAHRPADA